TPFRWYNNPYSYETGNPFILPFISNNIQLNYTKDDFMISAYAQFIKDGYGSVDIFDNNEWIYTYENYLDQHRYGLTSSYYLTVMKWWEADLFATYYKYNLITKVDYIAHTIGFGFDYQVIKLLEADLLATFYQNNLKSKFYYIDDKTGYGFSYQVNNNFFIDKDKNYIISLNYWQDRPFWDNNIYNHSFGSLDLGCNISFL